MICIRVRWLHVREAGHGGVVCEQQKNESHDQRNSEPRDPDAQQDPQDSHTEIQGRQPLKYSTTPLIEEKIISREKKKINEK